MKTCLLRIFLVCLICFNGLIRADTHEEVTLLTLPNYYPFSFTLPDGTYTGLYVELWQLWSETNAVPLRIETSTIEEINRRIRTEKNVLSHMFTSDERSQWADFALPIHAVQTGVVFSKTYPSDSTLESVNNAQVAVLAGSHQATYIAEKYPSLRQVPYTNTEQAIEDLINNKVDVIVGELPNIKTALARLGLAGVFEISDEVLYTKTVHPAVGKGQTELLTLINQGIRNIAVNDIIALEKKWLPTLTPFFENERSLNALTIEERQWLQTHKQFTVGIDDNLPPFEFINESGNFVGIAADYLNHAADVLGVRFVPQKDKTWLESFALLKEREVDLMSAAIVTESRKSEMDFTEPYVEMSTAIVVRRNSIYSDMESLNDKTLGLVEGDFVDFVRQDYPGINIRIVTSEVEGLEVLQAGSVDAFIAPIAVANYEIHKRNMNDLIIAAFAPYNLTLTMAVRKGLEPLASILNKTFASMPLQQRSVIENAWLRSYVYSGVSTMDILKWVIPVVLVFLLGIIFIVTKTNTRLNALLSKNKKLARRIVAIQEEERKILSRDLHDEIGQNLTALQYHINAAKDVKSEQDLKAVLDSIGEITAITYRSSYELMHWLRPMVLDDYGLEHALSNHIIVKLLSDSDIQYHQNFSGDFTALNDDISTNIYRIAQECITNAAKHSKAKNLWLTLSLANNCLTLTVRDDGVGFDVKKEYTREGGLGIEGIQDRLDAMDGTLELTSDSNGTRYEIMLWLEPSQTMNAH